MPAPRRYWAVLGLVGVLGFLAVVVPLHFVQPGYDPRHQLMSELALGPHGSFMLIAFLLMATSLIAVAAIARGAGSAIALQLLFLAAAGAFVASGAFPLGPETSDIHIGAIALAFVLSVLGMYLAPSGPLGTLAPRILSWPLAAGVALAVVLGHSVLPMGIGQRLAASCLLAWLAAVCARALRTDRR